MLLGFAAENKWEIFPLILASTQALRNAGARIADKRGFPTDYRHGLDAGDDHSELEPGRQCVGLRINLTRWSESRSAVTIYLL